MGVTLIWAPLTSHGVTGGDHVWGDPGLSTPDVAWGDAGGTTCGVTLSRPPRALVIVSVRWGFRSGDLLHKPCRALCASSKMLPFPTRPFLATSFLCHTVTPLPPGHSHCWSPGPCRQGEGTRGAQCRPRLSPRCAHRCGCGSYGALLPVTSRADQGVITGPVGALPVVSVPGPPRGPC